MKKICNIFLVTMLTLLFVLPVSASEEITVEKGQYLEVGTADKVDIYNELDTNLIWENVEVENIDGVANVLIPSDNPLKIIHVHIVKDNEENVLKVNLTEPHEHQPHLVEFIRPTETEPGRMEYFTCDCGKYFEDRACTVEITEDIDTWSYIAPVPKEEWGEGNPVPYIAKYDDKQVTDQTKPNPTWTEEEVNNYEKEEIEIQTELEERKVDTSTDVTTNMTTDVTTNMTTDMTISQLNEVEEPVALSVQPVVATVEPTLLERVIAFLKGLFK